MLALRTLKGHGYYFSLVVSRIGETKQIAGWGHTSCIPSGSPDQGAF
jgi:hypothetical protein